MDKFKRMLQNTGNIFVAILIILGCVLIFCAASFAVFTLGYWLVTLILANFFGFILPFSGWYSFGAGLIWLILLVFISPGKININN